MVVARTTRSGRCRFALLSVASLHHTNASLGSSTHHQTSHPRPPCRLRPLQRCPSPRNQRQSSRSISIVALTVTDNRSRESTGKGAKLTLLCRQCRRLQFWGDAEDGSLRTHWRMPDDATADTLLDTRRCDFVSAAAVSTATARSGVKMRSFARSMILEISRVRRNATTHSRQSCVLRPCMICWPTSFR